VAAGVLTALVLPENGKSAMAVGLIGAAYICTGAVYLLARDTDPFAPAGVVASDQPVAARVTGAHVLPSPVTVHVAAATVTGRDALQAS